VVQIPKKTIKTNNPMFDTMLVPFWSKIDANSEPKVGKLIGRVIKNDFSRIAQFIPKLIPKLVKMAPKSSPKTSQNQSKTGFENISVK